MIVPTHVAFGVVLSSSLELRGVSRVEHITHPDVSIVGSSFDQVVDRWSGGNERVWAGVLDGTSFTLAKGVDGDHLMSYTDALRCHVSQNRDVLLRAVADERDLECQRVFLDTGLLLLSLLRGNQMLHASAVVIDGRAIAFVSASGGGKTSLAVEMLGRGGLLLCDDVLALSRSGKIVIGHVGPAVMNVSVSGPGDIADIGEEIGRFGDEAWVAVDRVAPVSAPLGAVVLVARREGSSLECRAGGSVLDLLPHALSVDHSSSASAARFDMFSAVASSVPVMRLSSDLSVRPADLADAVMSALETHAKSDIS